MSVDDERDPDYVARTWNSYSRRGRESAVVGGTSTFSGSGQATSETYTPSADVSSGSASTASGDPRTETTGGTRQASAATRRARLRLSRIDPISTAKVAFVVSLVCFVALFVAVGILYGVLSSMGVFDTVDSAVTTLTASQTELFPASAVFGYTFLAGLLNVALITAGASVGAVIYNVIADLAGGIELTLTDSHGR